MATEGTIRSNAWEDNLKKEIPNIEVINKACPLLASIAEDEKSISKEGKEAIHSYTEIFKENNVDTIILGCTHYPICEDVIRQEFPYKVNLVNTGMIVAQSVKEYLEDNNMKNIGKKNLAEILVSKNDANFNEKVKNILFY